MKLMLALLLPLTACTDVGGPGPLVGDATGWYRTFGGKNTDDGGELALGPDGGLYLSITQAYPDVVPDAWFYRLDTTGEVLWESPWSAADAVRPGPLVVGADAVYAGGVVYTGDDDWSAAALVLGLDRGSGTLLWDYRWDADQSYDQVNGLALDGDDLYAFGWTQHWEGSSDALYLHLTSTGEEQLVKTWGDDTWQEFLGHPALREGQALVTGRTGGEGGTLAGDVLLAAVAVTDGDIGEGELVWSAVEGEAGERLEAGMDLLATDDAVFICGLTDDPLEGRQLGLWAFDLQGGLLWQSVWAGAGEAMGLAIQQDLSSGDLIVAASTRGEGIDSQMAVLRFNQSGDLLDSAIWTGSGQDEASGLVVQEGVFTLVGTTVLGAGALDAILVSGTLAPLAFPAVVNE